MKLMQPPSDVTVTDCNSEIRQITNKIYELEDRLERWKSTINNEREYSQRQIRTLRALIATCCLCGFLLIAAIAIAAMTH